MTLNNKLKIQEAMLLSDEASITYSKKIKRKKKSTFKKDIDTLELN